MDDRAVSPLIGFVLLMAIVMGLIGILQSTAVPQWNREVEAKHFSSLRYEFADLSEVVSISASTRNPAKVVLRAGVDYPNYYILFSPSKASTTISAKELSVQVKGMIAGAEAINLDDTTSAIIVEPNYLYSQRTKMVYEHSAVLRIENDFVLADSEQNAFSNNSISLTLIKANFNSFATTESANLILIPISVGGKNVFSGNITFESYDEKTARWWNETLNRAFQNSGVTVQINSTDSKKVDVKNLRNVTLSISVFEAYALASGEITTTPISTNLNLQNLVDLNPTVLQHSAVSLGVRVFSDYGNVKGAMVRIENSCNGENISRFSDDFGEVWYTFYPNSTGSCNVKFGAGGAELTFRVNVVQQSGGGGGGGTFNLSWHKEPNDGRPITEFLWDVRSLTNQTDFYVEVSLDNNPVSSIPIYFALNNSSIVTISDRSTTTNSTGWGYVNLTANMNGTVKIVAVVGDSSAMLNITVTNAGQANLPPTAPTLTTDKKYYRSGETITATASGSTDPEGDPITYSYKFVDQTSSNLLKDWSADNTYTITSGEEGHRIRVYAKACDDKGACSSEVFTEVGVIKIVVIGDQTAISDSHVRSLRRNINYGTSALLYSGYTNAANWGILRTFIKFDLPPELSDSQIINATLYLYKSGHNGTPTAINLGAHRVTASWSETTITWNNQPTFSASATWSITPPTTNNIYLGWNVTSDVQGFVDGSYQNYGWCIKSSNENSVTRIQFNSKENAVNTRPYLYIEYAPKVS